MMIHLLKSKIHRATVTDTELSYVGSVTVDRDLMEAADLAEFEKVLVANLETGARFETYCLEGPAGGGSIRLNGAAARLATTGDKVIIMAFGLYAREEAVGHRPKVVFVDGNNRRALDVLSDRD